jgi:hypothetical protein
VVGKSGWQIGPDPQTGAPVMGEIGGSDVLAIDFERWREPELLLLKAADPAAQLTPMPDESIDGKPQTVVSLKSPFGIELKLYLDKKTKLMSRVSYNEGGNSEVDDFTDYKDVKGVKVSFKRRSVGSGKDARGTDLVVKTVEIDPTVDSKIFDKPAAP